VLILEGRKLQVLPRILRVLEQQQLFFMVRRYKSLLNPFVSLSYLFRPATLRTHSLLLFTPLGLGLVNVVGDLRRD
jgi:hypothetical protein